MSGDYSRFTFDPALNQGGVLLQQGRPLTDADWNEQVATASRRAQAVAADAFAPSPSTAAVVPATTPNGFQINLASNTKGPTLMIERGRMYVDGLLVENHGAGAPSSWDPVLAEPFDPTPVDYFSQPYMNAPAPLPQGGPHLIYLDVWQRELTPSQRPELVESALGVDTTTRLQTVWQVKLLPFVVAKDGTAVGKSTPLDQIQGWDMIAAPSAGRLTVGAVSTTPTDAGPCPLPMSSGFRGLENQLYRVEIHSAGAHVPTTFKWSRDNASVETVIESTVGTSDGMRLLVQSTGRDDILRFNIGDWIEVIDDTMELADAAGAIGSPGAGQMCKVTDVDDAARTIDVTPGVGVDLTRHPRIRRWDQRGQVFLADGKTVYFDLDRDPNNSGVIPVPTDPATKLILESGITVSFDVATPGGAMRTSDYWTFAARSGSGQVEPLVGAPPQGIHHHYAKLATLDMRTQTVPDLRVHWPLPVTLAADPCGCTVCVTPESHANGTSTIAQAVAQVATTGGTIALAAGDYALTTEVGIANATGVHIRGQGPSTRILSTGRAFNIQFSQNITLADFAIQAGTPQSTTAYDAITAGETQGLRLERLNVLAQGSSATAASMNADGELTIRDSVIASLGSGVVTSASPFGTIRLDVQGSTIPATKGITIGGSTTGQPNFTLFARIVGNRFGGGSYGVGLVSGPGEGSLIIDANEFNVPNVGIAGIVSTIQLTNNRIAVGNPNQTAVRLFGTKDSTGHPANARIAGNEIAGFGGDGIAIDGTWDRIAVTDNRIANSLRAVVIGIDSTVDDVSVVSNRITDATAFGILVQNAKCARVQGNVLRNVAAGPVDVDGIFFGQGIVATNVVDLDISSNDLIEIGPAVAYSGSVYGIAVVEPMVAVTVRGNTVRRSWKGPAANVPFNEDWAALVVGASIRNPPIVQVGPPTGNPLALRIAAPPTPRPVPRSLTFAQILNFVGAYVNGPRPDLGIDLNSVERVLVEGNTLAASLTNLIVALVLIESSNDVIFTNNHCEELGSFIPGKSEVMINAPQVMATNNCVHNLGIAITSPPGATVRAAVLGNICAVNPLIDGVSGVAPWGALNVLG